MGVIRLLAGAITCSLREQLLLMRIVRPRHVMLLVTILLATFHTQEASVATYGATTPFTGLSTQVGEVTELPEEGWVATSTQAETDAFKLITGSSESRWENTGGGAKMSRDEPPLVDTSYARKV